MLYHYMVYTGFINIEAIKPMLTIVVNFSS